MRFDEVSARYGEFGTFFRWKHFTRRKSREIFTHINREKGTEFFY